MAYLYRHIRLDTNQPFYIGVGGLETFDDYERSRTPFNRSQFWKNVVNKTDYEVEIMLDDLSRKEAFEKETEFINLYGRSNLGKGVLCNLSNGGEGRIGSVNSESTRQKISIANKGKKKPIGFGEKVSVALSGIK